MRIKNKKLTKWLTLLCGGSLIMGGVSGFAASAAYNFNKNTTSLNKESGSATKAPDPSAGSTTSFDILDNLIFDVADLNNDFANLYFSQIDFKNPTADPNAQAIISRLQDKINGSAGYWNGEKPGAIVKIKVDAPIINYNSNPNIAPGFCNALKVSLLDASNNVVDKTVISLVGFKAIAGKTYPLDTFKGVFSDSENTTASFVWADPTFVAADGAITAPTIEKVKEKLLANSNFLLNSIFANLPNGSNFKIEAGDVTVQLVSPTPDAYETYRYFNYKITLNKTLITSSNGDKTNTNPAIYDLKVYVPSSLNSTEDNTSGAIQTVQSFNVINKNDITSIRDIKTAGQFDAKRTNDSTAFLNGITEIVRSNVINPAPDLTNEDIQVLPMITSTNSSYLNDNLGLVAYSVTLNKVKAGGGYTTNKSIKFNIVVTGFDKKLETQYFTTLSVQSVVDLKNKFPTQFIGQAVSDHDLFHTMANNGIVAYKSGSTYDPTGVTDPVARDMFKAKDVKYNFAQANYNDQTGTISNVIVTIQGYYNQKGTVQDLPTNTKQLVISINGFKTSADTTPTRVDPIDAPSQYNNYPAQAFIAGLDTTTNKPKPMVATTSSLPADFNSRVKELIKPNISNLPATEGNLNPDNWIVSDIQINNFSGTITGTIAFPDIYVVNDNGKNVIKNNFAAGTTSPAAGYAKTEWTIEGFDIVSGSTSVSNLTTNQIIIENDFGYSAPVDASTMTFADFQKQIAADEKAFSDNVIDYYAKKTDKIIGNKWQVFDSQFAILSDGYTRTPDPVNETYTIKFKTNVFKPDGSYGPSELISITLNGFKSDSAGGGAIPSDKISSSLEQNGLLNNGTLSCRDKDIDEVKANITANDKNTIDEISTLITQQLANNVRASTGDSSPTYKISVLNKTDGLPGYLYLNVQFKTNYFVNGKFITAEQSDEVSNKVTVVTIFGFKTKGTSSISPFISVTGNHTLEALKASDFAQGDSHHADLVKLLESNSANIVGTINDSVEFLWDGKTTSMNNVGGVGYEGIVNNINGTVEISYRFKAGKWNNNGATVATESDIYKVTISGFTKLTEAEIKKTQWYNSEFNIDVSAIRTQWNNNALASMIVSKLEAGVQKNNYFNDETKTNFTNAILKSNALIKSSLQSTLLPVVRDNLTIDWENIVADNVNGSAVVPLRVHGNGIYDPENGLPCTTGDFSFKVIVYGFDHATPTTISNSIALTGIKKDANATAEQVKLEVTEKGNVKALFQNTLPRGFFDIGEDAGGKYVFIPQSQFSGPSLGKDNIEHDYSAGTVTIKQLALFYYYDKDNNLVMPDKDWTTTGANMKDWEDGNTKGFNESCYNEEDAPAPGQKYKYKLFENIKVSGFVPALPTAFKQQVDISQGDISPSEFVKKYSQAPVPEGTPAGDPPKTDYNWLITKLIYNKKANSVADKDPVGPDSPEGILFNPENPPVNNLAQYVENYSKWTDKEPVLRIDESATGGGVEYDNIKGTVILHLKAICNYFYYDSSKVLQWKNSAKIGDPIKGTVTVSGFKTITPTTIASEMDITSAKNAPTNIFQYVTGIDYSKDLESTLQILNKAVIYRVILENITSIVKNGYDIKPLIEADPSTMTDDQVIELVEKYLTIEVPYVGGVPIDVADFTNMKVTFNIKLMKYYDKDGIAVDATDPASGKHPLEQQFSFYSFPNEPLDTTLYGGEINLETLQGTGWDNLPFFCTAEDIKNAIISEGVNPESKNFNFIQKRYSNLVPTKEYNSFDKADSLLSIDTTSVKSEHPGTDANNFVVTFELTLRNAIVKKTLPSGKTIKTYGNLKSKFRITRWAGRTATQINEKWPLVNVRNFSWNEYFSKEEADRITYVQNLLTTPVQIWKKYCKNIRTDSTFAVTGIVQESPAEANKSLTITVKVVGTYNDELTFNSAGEVTQTVVLQNLPVQKGTDVIKGKFIDLKTYQNPVVNFLPSELNQVKGPDGKPAYSKQGQQFIDFLNNHNNGQLIKEEIFSNPYIGTDDTNPNDRTKIVGYRVSNYDDLSGVANIKLLYVNYYDASGKLILDKDGTGKDPYPSKNITFTGFAKASPTTVGNTYVDVKDYFKLPGLDTGSAVPEQFENLTPGQIVDDIERRVLAIEDKRQQSIEFKNNVIGIVKPLFVGAGNVEWTESQNILDSKGYLRITSDSDLITQKIIIPGKVQGQVGGGMNVGADVPPEKGSVTPVKEQQLQNTLKVKFEPGFSEDTSGTGKKQIDIRKTFIADNRLGTLSFKVSVTGFWRAIDPDGISTEIEETPDIVDATPTATADGSDPVVNQQSVTITITGLKKDVAVETQSANLIVICTSIAGGVAALILLIAFIIKLKKFGTGGY